MVVARRRTGGCLTSESIARTFVSNIQCLLVSAQVTVN
jgi:hypothetical protein